MFSAAVAGIASGIETAGLNSVVAELMSAVVGLQPAAAESNGVRY